MVQANIKHESSLKQPVGYKANPCKKQVLAIKFTEFFRKHIKIFSLLFTLEAELSFFSLYPPFPFSLQPTNTHDIVSPFDLASCALCP